ncbi:MAG TPA: VVA0879 family protein [Polyangiaceae bacterium]|nr:VVA0879 family protein [Polyangiaceae bacterium]
MALGVELFGQDPRAWRFKCPRCGHEQSHNEATARKPDLGDTSNWIYFACEGRRNPVVGCDWTLGGLFQIHTLEVVEDSGRAVRCMRFAHHLVDELLTTSAKLFVMPQQPTTDAKTWLEYTWPDWVPARERELVEDFWSDKSGRGPREYHRDMSIQSAPIFGVCVTLRKLCGDNKVTGRYVHRWNSIGAVVLDDGTSQAVGF